MNRIRAVQPNDPETTLRIGRALDKLRPFEASIRYQRFLHQLEIDRIHAYADLYARYGPAVAEAHNRILLIERDRR